MIPILYKRNETDFTTNGIGRLSDAIRCTVTEARNGVYELEMQYPIDGRNFDAIELETLISARHSDATDVQPFRVYRISKPLNGVVTVNARHISYDLTKVTVTPFSADTVAEALQGLALNALYNCPFSFATDKTTTGRFTVSEPSTIRSLLGGSEGSILDVYGGGEYEFDKFLVRLHTARGTASGVTIRYGKNLTDLLHVHDSESQYSGVAPFWANGDTVITLPEGAIYSDDAAKYYDAYTDKRRVPYTNQNGIEYGGYLYDIKIVPLDLSQAFDEAPTVAQLRDAATAYLNSTANKAPTESVKVNFVQLWQTEEYKEYAPLQRAKLCDTVDVIYTKLGVKVSAKVIKTVYNVLLERYNSMEIGDAKSTLASSLAKTSADMNSIRKLAEGSSVTMSDVAAAIRSNSEKITGALGGYVVIDANTSTGYPERILVMDTPDTSTAQNVIQINSAGIGFSQNGINGPYNTAWTIDGSFTASFISTWSLSASQITSGTMSANLIKGGILKIGGTASGAGGNGVLAIYNSSNTQVGTWNVNGLSVGSNFSVDMSGNVTANSATLTSANVSGTITTGNLTATGGTIGNWYIGTNQLTAYNTLASGTAGTQYQVQLQSQANITGSDWAFNIRQRSYNGSSYGSWVATVYMSYNGEVLFSAVPETGQIISGGSLVDGYVTRQFKFLNGRLILYRNEATSASATPTSYWTGFIDEGTYTQQIGSTSRTTRYLGLCTYPTNMIGFCVTQTGTTETALTSQKTPIFYYNGQFNSNDGSRGIMICNRDLYMQQARIENASRVQITNYGYAVSGLSRQLSGTDALFQMSYASNYTFFYLNGSQIGSLSSSSSDRKLKKNIKTIDEGLLERIDAVEFKQFQFKKATGFGDYTHYGAIAQDVQEAIGETESNIVYTAPESEDLNLNYTEFLVLKVAALEKRLKAIEAKMEV